VKDLINIDNVSKYFIWMPPKTGSRLCTKIFQNSDFHTYKINNGSLNKVDEKFTHSHNCDLFNGHEDYKLILTCRNPYSALVSMFKMWGPSEVIRTNYRDKFDDFVTLTLQYKEIIGWSSLLKNLHKRIPDYFVRIESVDSDYKSLPIMKKHKNFLNGKLNYELSEKVGSWKDRYNKNNFPEDWRLFYSRSTAENVYYYFANYFEILDYDKNSWKT
jgi:hypothetical protein